jgi:xylan 1,4-beta-xylosidase
MTTLTQPQSTTVKTLEPSALIQNPILRGFNPDPSILRVGEDYYIATSTFEWFPGVQIHHSRDLVNWRVLTQPLARVSQLDMRGNGDSGGIWAPCLSYDDGIFYLIYTDVKAFSMHAPFKDTHNYLVTASNIKGPWSEPIYLNSSGFDPSLFHDSDGRKWFLNMVWDHRQGKNPFGGIYLQEYDAVAQKLVGPVKNIFLGSPIGVTEGPHVYKRNGWYYLLTAEGGTTYEHAATLARSKHLEGPYEIYPQNPLLTSFQHPELELQKAGHASIVNTQNDEWYIVHLCGRPLEPGKDGGFCNLGRETAIQKLEWGQDDWVRIASGGNNPQSQVVAPNLEPHPFPTPNPRDNFDAPNLEIAWQSLREPVNSSWLSLSERPGHLRLFGRESLNSVHHQSLIGRRLQAFHAQATTSLEFAPQHFQQMAGIAAYYDSTHWVYLRVSRDETLGKTLNLLVCDKGFYSEPLAQEIPISSTGSIYLRVNFNRATFQFSYSSDNQTWHSIGPAFDSSHLSDDYCNGLAFTGTFIALCVQDLAGTKLHADFDFFEYLET